MKQQSKVFSLLAGVKNAPVTKVAAAKTPKPKQERPAKGAPGYIYSKAEILAGEGWPCTAGCTRKLRSEKRASVHAADREALQLAGHLAI